MSDFEIIETMARIIELQNSLILRLTTSLKEVDVLVGELTEPELSEIAKLQRMLDKES